MVSVEEVLEMAWPLLFSGMGFEFFLHSLGGRQRKHLNHWGMILVPLILFYSNMCTNKLNICGIQQGT
jgi:hypothetical protein